MDRCCLQKKCLFFALKTMKKEHEKVFIPKTGFLGGHNLAFFMFWFGFGSLFCTFLYGLTDLFVDVPLTCRATGRPWGPCWRESWFCLGWFEK